MENYYGAAASSASPALNAVYVVFCIAAAVIGIIAMWKIFTKAGKPGWASIVPFYNLYIEFEITWGKGIMFLLLLIPVVNVIISLITMAKLAKAFGKDIAFTIGLIFLPFIFMLILAFGSSQYIGVDGIPANQPMYEQPAYQAPVAPAEPQNPEK